MLKSEINKQVLDNMMAINEWNRSTYNVLVLDDDPAIINLIRKTLDGCTLRKVKTYMDEFEAIRTFNEEHFDLCIIDISLENSNGFVLGKLFRSMSYNEFPIIYISNDRDNLNGFYQNDQPNTYFYKKPIIKNDFLEVFQKMSNTNFAKS